MGSFILASLNAAFHSLQNPYRSADASLKNHPGLKAFETDLADRLEQLKDAGELSYCNIAWLREAMYVVLFAQSSVQGLLPNLTSSLSDREHKLLEENMEDSVKLLDVCNVLKEVIMDMEHYLMLVQFALRSLDLKESINDAKLARARNALSECVEALAKKEEEFGRQGEKRSKLETCTSMLRRMGEKSTISYSNDASKSTPLFNAMHGAKHISILICGVLAAALSVKPKRSVAVAHVASQSLWSASFLRLQQKVREEVDSRKSKGYVSLLHELNRVDGDVRDLQGLLETTLADRAASPKASFSPGSDKEDLRQLVKVLATSWEDLQTGLEPLKSQINELFRILVAIRVDILDALCHPRS